MLVTILCVATPSLGTRAAVVFTTVKVGSIVSPFSRRLCGRVIDRKTPCLGPYLYTRLYTDCPRKGLPVVKGTAVRGFEHKSDFVCTCLLLWTLGIRWLGSGEFRGGRDEESAENPPEGYPFQHVPCNGEYMINEADHIRKCSDLTVVPVLACQCCIFRRPR